MASKSGLTWESMVKAGTDMMETAGASLQRTMKIQEVTGTKDNDSQPAYALNELVQACNKNSDEARAIASALLRRAASSNPVIKWKALRAIRYICHHASTAQFKKSCGGPNASVIRESISWSGPPHPQLGNALNLRVREAAKETLDEVFRVSAAPAGGAATAAGGSGLQGRIQGYGSTTGGKIQGSGSMGGGGGGAGGGMVGTGGKKYGGISSDDYFSGNSGGRWQSWSDASPSGGANGSVSAAAASSALSSTAGTSAARAAVGSEESVVAELCRGSGGVQPRPTPEALRVFVAKASQLDAEVVALELTHKLFNTPWQERVRALDGMHAIGEAVKARGGGHPLQATLDSLCSVTEAFGGVLGHENPAVRAAAGRVMRALGVEAAVATAVASTPMAAAGAADAGGDLLGRLDEGSAAPAPAAAAGGAAAPAAPAAPPQMDDLLGGLGDVADAGAAGSSQPVPDALGGLDALDGLGGLGGAPAAAPATPTPVAAATDMFAGLTVSRDATAPAAAAPAVAEADPLESLLGGLGDVPLPNASAPPVATPDVANGAAAALAPPTAAAPFSGLDDLDSLMSGAPAALPPTPAQARAAATGHPGMAPTPVASGMNGMHGMPTTAPTAAPGAAQFGAQPDMVPPGMFGGAALPAVPVGVGGALGLPFGGQQGMAYPGVAAGMQQGFGLQAPAGAWNGQAAMSGGQPMPGMPGGAMVSPAGAPGVAMGMGPQGSLGTPVTQHAFAHAKGSLGGHKDAFDFVNDVMRK
eukprot:jgi/Ulvmu1/8630/UM046_0033.1